MNHHESSMILDSFVRMHLIMTHQTRLRICAHLICSMICSAVNDTVNLNNTADNHSTCSVQNQLLYRSKTKFAKVSLVTVQINLKR
jgi:hypothetical protein